MAFSFWEDQTWLQHHDAIIVGGGIVGVSAACHLASIHPDWRIAVFERSAFGDGGTTRNAGFACFGSPAELLEDRRILGDEAALRLVQSRLEGLAAMRAWLGDEAVGFQPTGSHALYLNHGTAMPPVSETELKDLNRWIQPATRLGQTFYRKSTLPDRGLASDALIAVDASPLEGAVHTGMLHRSLMAKAHAAGISVVRGVHVRQIEAGSPVRLAVTRSSTDPLHEVRTPRCLVATNAFARELLPQLDSHPASNRVLVTSPVLDPGYQGTYHLEAGYVYARHLEGGRLLIGGGRHWGLDEAHTEARLVDWLRAIWPAAARASIDYAWTGTLGIGSAREPLVERINEGLVAAVRLGGMGVAIGVGLGQRAAELLAKSR